MGLLADRELRSLGQDPAALLAMVVAPFVIAVIAGVSLGAPPKVNQAILVAVAPGRVAPPALVTAKNVRVQQASEAEARSEVKAATVAAAVVVPADAREAPRVIADEHNPLTTAAAHSLAVLIAAYDRSPTHGITTVFFTRPVRGHTLGGIEVFGPVVAVFFVLFGVGFVSRSLHLERSQGILGRLLAEPVRASAVIAAKVLLMVAIGMIEVGSVLVGTALLFGARWGNLAAVGAVAMLVVTWGVLTSVAIVGFTRTSSHAQAIEVTIALLFAALGGHMVPLRNLPPVAATIARFTPNGAAIDGFLDLAAGARAIPALVEPAIVIGAYAFVLAVVALPRVRTANLV